MFSLHDFEEKPVKVNAEKHVMEMITDMGKVYKVIVQFFGGKYLFLTVPLDGAHDERWYAPVNAQDAPWKFSTLCVLVAISRRNVGKDSKLQGHTARHHRKNHGSK